MRSFNMKEEYSERFDEIRKASMEQSFYKYGPVKANYGVDGNVNAIESLKKYLKRYEETGNTEFLTDVANFAMMSLCVLVSRVQGMQEQVAKNLQD